MSNPDTESKPTTPAESAVGEGLGASPVREFCRYCEKPEANQHEWDTLQGGEGPHLCWGECGVDAEEALDNERAKIAAIREVLLCPDYTNPEGMVGKLLDILSNEKLSD